MCSIALWLLLHLSGSSVCLLWLLGLRMVWCLDSGGNGSIHGESDFPTQFTQITKKRNKLYKINIPIQLEGSGPQFSLSKGNISSRRSSYKSKEKPLFMIFWDDEESHFQLGAARSDFMESTSSIPISKIKNLWNKTCKKLMTPKRSLLNVKQCLVNVLVSNTWLSFSKTRWQQNSRLTVFRLFGLGGDVGDDAAQQGHWKGIQDLSLATLAATNVAINRYSPPPVTSCHYRTPLPGASKLSVSGFVGAPNRCTALAALNLSETSKCFPARRFPHLWPFL